jgi:co-chaperonin GroES (HSP10)
MRGIKPLKNNIVVELAEVKQQGDIIIPDIAKEKSLEGIVNQVGAGVQIPEIKPGARVLLNRYGGQEFQQGGKTFKLVDASSVQAIIE